MIKKFTLLLLAMLSIAGAHAKVFENQLWKGSEAAGSTNVVEISASELSGLKAGDAIRVYITNTDGASYAIWYGTDKTTTPRLCLSAHDNGWGWVNGGSAYEDVTLSAEDVTNLTDNKIFIQISSTASTVLTKVTHYGEVATTSETELLDANWTASWTAKVFSAQASAKIGDVIRVKYYGYKDESTEWPWVQFHFMDGSGTSLIEPIVASKEKNVEQVFDYEITTPEVMEKIQSNGFSIKGDQFVLTSVKLLTYADSYEGVTVTIGADGIRTWSHAKNLDFSETGITAYYASAVETGQVTLTSTATTRNDCGYILMGDEDTYIAKVVPDAQASYPSDNLLRGQVTSGTVYRSVYDSYTGGGDDETNIKTKYRYILAKNNEGDANIGFYKLTSDHTLGAHKAYLETDTDITPKPAQGAPAIHLVFDEENNATSIEDVKQAEEAVKFFEDGKLLILRDGITYDVMGRVIR